MALEYYLKKKDIENENTNVKNRKQKSIFEKIPPTYGVYHQHFKYAHLQSLIFNQTDINECSFAAILGFSAFHFDFFESRHSKS